MISPNPRTKNRYRSLNQLKASKTSSKMFRSFLSLGSLVLIAHLPLVANASTDAEPKVFATQISKDNAAALIRSGPDAIGGINDWFISNGTLCAIVSDLRHEGEFSAKGGSLIDLGFCGRADDHYSFSHDLLQGSRWRPLDGSAIHLENTENTASVIVTGQRDGAKIFTRYTLSADSPTQLKIKKSLSQNLEHPNAEKFNFFSMLNFNYHSLEPFVFASKNLQESNGFNHQDFVNRGESAITEASRNADTIITISPPTARHGISYGWHLKSAERVTDTERYQVPSFVLADDASNAMLILNDTFYIGDGSEIGWLQLPQLLMLSLDDATLETDEIIYVGKRGDVASITDQFFNDKALLSGQVDEHNVAIHIQHRDGTPLTHVRPDRDGRFKVKLPEGDYQLHIKGSASRVLNKSFSMSNESQSLGKLIMPTPARLSLPKGQAMRLVFVGINGTPNPNFEDTLTGLTVQQDEAIRTPSPVSQVFLAGTQGDARTVELAPGKYRVYATRGPEFSLEKTEIEIQAGSNHQLKIKSPERALSTPNYIASDLHVHSGLSFDNTFSELDRVRTFVAEHGEVMVASEHDVPVDFTPYIEELSVGDKIVAIPAAEVTSLLPTELNPYSGGHANVFPYYPNKLAFRRGMVNHENQRWRDTIHELRKHQGDDVVIQLNHPRADLQLSGPDLPEDWSEMIDNGHFLSHMGSAGHPYNPHLPLHEHPNNVLVEVNPDTGLRDIDFDLIEVINPGGEEHNERIQAVRQDWLSMVKQGEKLVGTANSDSHGSHNQVAVPRTMVSVKDDRVSAFNQTEFLSSLKRGNAYGTTGPMLEVSLGGKMMGDTFSGERGPLSVKISSADWIPVSTVKVQVNGETIDQYTVTGSPPHTLRVPIAFNKDSFVTVEVSGPASSDYSAVYPDISPYAFSNPIFVDYDSDGKWLPPGL